MSFFCSHARQTDPVDGAALCLDCGSPIREHDLERDLLDAIDLVQRDYGRYGRHSRACIRVDGDPPGTAPEWCCASDCTISRPRSA